MHAETPDREPESSATSRDTRIEQLLLAGLDRYFAGELEHAIQVWSRVFFLDRGHARARAYIERARAAIAEREREAEARVHRADAWRTGAFETLGASGPSSHVETSRDAVTLLRRDFPGSGPAPAVALATLVDDEAAFAPDRAPSPIDGRGKPANETSWPRVAAHAMLVLLAAALLFTAGYVVAARDRLAAWWTASAAAEPSEPAAGAGAAAEQGAAGSVRPHGSASR